MHKKYKKKMFFKKNSNDDFWISYAAKFLFQEIPILKHNLDQHFCTTGNSKKQEKKDERKRAIMGFKASNNCL